MKKLLMLVVVFGLVFLSCSDTDPPVQPPFEPQDFEVPELTNEFTSIMSTSDIARFELGPGETYMRRVYNLHNEGTSYGDAEWHPILMFCV